MEYILLLYALIGFALLIEHLRFHRRYGTRAERKVLEEQLLKDIVYLHSKPFTRKHTPNRSRIKKQNFRLSQQVPPS